MTKAATKAEKRRRKRARKITLPGGDTYEPRQTSRQGERTDLDPVALNARCRHAGLEESTKNRIAMSAQMQGCPVGRMIWAAIPSPEERARLWGAVQHMRKVYAIYYRAIAAPNPHAQCLRILTPTDPLQADTTTPPIDTRPQEDRDRAAVRAYMVVQGWLELAGKDTIGATKRAVLDQTEGEVKAWPLVQRGLHGVADGLRGG